MSVFIDTDVFYAHHDTDAPHHESARAFFESVLEGAFGQPYTNEFVLAETITVTRRRTGDVDAATRVADRIIGNDPYPDVISLESITPAIRAEALEWFRRHDRHDLSFTDAATIAHCRMRDIDTIASFDATFDGIHERTDPRTLVE